MTRVFLDANILIAATVRDGPAREFMHLAGRQIDITLLTNEYGLDEAERHIQRFRPSIFAVFRKLREQVRAEADPTDQMKTFVKLNLLPGTQLRDKDLPIMTGAVASVANWLVTRDRDDFHPLYGKTVLGVEVIRFGTARARLNQSARGDS